MIITIKKAIISLSLFLIIFLLFESSEASDKRFDFTKVVLSSKEFNPSKDQTVSISFETTIPVTAKVIIYDALGRMVRELEATQESCKHNIVWNGKNEDSKIACGNVFLYIIEAQARNGKSVVYNRAVNTGGIEAKPLDFKLDKMTGNMEYVLPAACMVRIRAGLRDGMFAKSIIDWQPQTAGRHFCQWDGKDESGLVMLRQNPDLDIRLSCYTLPDNSIIVKNARPFEISTGPLRVVEKRNKIWATEGKYIHYRHDPRLCHTPKFEVKFPTAMENKTKSTYAISGISPVRVELDRTQAWNLESARFEVAIYIDGVYLYEMEESSNPFTYMFDTRNVAEGLHIITINIISQDHVGAVSKKVIIKKPSATGV